MNVFIRYAEIYERLLNKQPQKVYDSRIIFPLSGNGKVYLSDRTETLARGTFFFYPPDCVYYPVSDKNDPVRFVTLNFDFTREFEHITESYQPVPVDEFDRKLFEKINRPSEYEFFRKPQVLQKMYFAEEKLLDVVETFHSPYRFANERASAKMQQVLYEVMDYQPDERGLFERTADYVNTHYGSIRSNSDVAAALNYHPYYLNRIVLKHSGQTLHTFIMNVKLKKSAEILLRTRLPVAAVAAECGFENPNHFSARFTSFFGMPPTVYRERNI